MGSNTSKSSNESAAVSLQKSDVGASSDPRSPTPEITRTPLQGKTGAKHSITKNADLRKNFENINGEEKLIHNNPILSAVIKNHLQSYDPRSPTQEFERTPVVIGPKIDNQTNEKKILRLQNEEHFGSPSLVIDDNETYDSCVEAQESPDLIVPRNLCNGFLEMTLDDTIEDSDEPLGSSTASNEAIESNISNENTGKPTQLLETNFEYVDTNMEKFKDGEECPQNDHNTTVDEMNNIPLFQILDSDPRSPSTSIERTPIVVAKLEVTTEDVEEMSDDTLIKVLQDTNAELRQTVTRTQDNPEGLLIYEDEFTDLNAPRESKSASTSGSRTPLSCMRNKTESGHARSKSANIQDSKDKKIDRRVSYIPRLKSLSKQTKLNPLGSSVSLKNISKTSAVSGDCENTPPHSHRDRWDKDNSIVL